MEITSKLCLKCSLIPRTWKARTYQQGIAGALAEKGILLQQDKLIIKYMCIITYDTVDLCHDNPPT
jgi:hypothetical protein